MPSITKYQRDYCQVAQLDQALGKTLGVSKFVAIDLVEQIDDVNLIVLKDKKGTNPLIGGTPLHVAAFHKHVDAFHELLKRGANFTIQNKFGDTALHRVFIVLFDNSNNTPSTMISTINNELIDLVLTAHVKGGVIKNPRSTHGLSHFHIACAANHIAAVQIFLDAGISVGESVNEESSYFAGYTPLHFATRFCGYAAAKILLKRGADVRAQDKKGLTPLHLNIKRNIILNRLKNSASCKNFEHWNRYLEESQKIMSLLLDDDRVVDVDSLGFRKSHAACTMADTSLAERFLQEGDVNRAISMDSPLCAGYTHLHFAARFNVEIVKLLLRKGANIETEDAEEKTPLDICRRYFNIENLHHILPIIPNTEDILFSDNKTRLSDFIHAMRTLSTFKSFFEMSPKDIVLPQNSPLWPGHSLTHLLVYFVSVIGLKNAALLFSRKPIIQQDVRGCTPIHLAFYKKKIDIVKLLFENQLEITDAVDRKGLSHLLIACEKEYAAVVKTLLSREVNTNVNVAYKGKTLSLIVKNLSTSLHVAVSRRNIEIIRLLVKNGADANAIDADGATPIHRLFQSKLYPYDQSESDEKIGELLLSSCDLRNVVSKTGLSHLHVAIYANNEKAVENLLDLGADANAVASSIYYHAKSSLNYTCFTECTPLHFYLKSGNERLLELLLRAGANILYKYADGMTLFYDLLNKCTFRKTDIDYISKEILLLMFTNNPVIRKRAKDDCGLTLLHIACYLRDVEQIQKLLPDQQVDVNAQMHENSVIWAKDTPLHLFMKSSNSIENLEDTVELLLKRGSDVTMTNADGDTPVHIAWCKEFDTWGNSYFVLLRLLLRYHKDFTINPINEQGVSHLHLVCMVGEYAVAERILETGVDVNLSVDYLNWKMTCQTPLLFMMKTPIDLESHLQTVDVLVKYGADTNAQDEEGSISLLNIAYLNSPRERYFEKLCEAGADVECTNLNGNTVLENLLNTTSYRSVTKEELNFFFGYSYLFNTYNSKSGKGILSLTILGGQPFVLDAMMEMPSLFTLDSLGRTPIQNLVANCTVLPDFDYAPYIERFVKMGYDIDSQDFEGKTALHLAAHFRNERAILGLLSAGSDINLHDNHKRTPLVMLSEIHLRTCNNTLMYSIEPAKNVIFSHMIGMLLCGLDINSEDLKSVESKLSEEQFKSYGEQVSRELQMSEVVNIGAGSLTLRDLLSETGVVASRPSMTSETDRQAVDELLTSLDLETFPKIKDLIKLQYKKMFTRLSMIQAATNSVRQLIGSLNGFSMPEICCRLILRFLSNIQIKHLIESVSE